MENLRKLLVLLIQELKEEILEYYSKYYFYIKDLYTYKKIDIKTNLSDLSDNIMEQGIYTMISATNSALNTIGISTEQLNSEDEIFNKMFKDHKKTYTNYDSFFELSLKQYINKFLFKIILEYLIGIDKKKIQNLDLFDLLPKNYLKKLNQFKNQNANLCEDKTSLQKIVLNLDDFYNATDFSLDLEKLNTLQNKIEEESRTDILQKLEVAKKENIEVLGKKNLSQALIQNQISINNNIKVFETKIELLDYFGNFPHLEQEIIDKLHINVKNFINSAQALFTFPDLENIFYFLTILSILGIDLPFSQEKLLDILKKFINGKVFSTGMYHKPNPISNFFGLSILSELGLINQTNLIDPLDIEMFLENELKNFLPEKLSLNFYSLMALKILERNGETINDKNFMIKPLINLDLLSLENKSFPIDMFYHIGLLKLIDNKINLKIFKNVYNTEIKRLISPNGLINNNLTDTARALLIYDLLDLKTEEFATVNKLFRNIIKYSNFFNDTDALKEFSWRDNKLALKVELRMLFWTLLAALQYSDF